MGRSSAIAATNDRLTTLLIGGNMKRTVALLLLLGSTTAYAAAKAISPPAQPEAPIPSLRLTMTNLLVGRVNPLGLEDQLRIGLQQKLYDSASPALRDNFIFFGAVPKLNP